MVGWWWLLPCWVCMVVAVAEGVKVEVVVVGVVDFFFGSGIYYFIVVVILFYCDIYIILLF